MYGDACRTNGSWDASGWLENEPGGENWDSVKEGETFLQPSASYSKRSSFIGDLRSKASQALKSQDEFISAPTEQAIQSAQVFINRLPEGCLVFRMALSQSGEINFFHGNDDDLFQILIDAEGTVSYYGVVDGKEVGDSNLPPENLPYTKLLSFVDRNK